MDVSSTTGSTSTSTSAVTPAASPNSQISSDFETFLKMMTVQLQNQDPLNPIESSDYAVQLATFSGVEQQVKTNDLLEMLSQQMGLGGLSQLAGWVGMEARAAAAATFDGSPIEVLTNPDKTADTAKLIVRDDAGTEVHRADIDAKGGTVLWAGVDANGSPLPSGNYSFHVESLKDGSSFGIEQAQVYALVSEAKMEDGIGVLVLASGSQIPADQISAIRMPAG